MKPAEVEQCATEGETCQDLVARLDHPPPPPATGQCEREKMLVKLGKVPGMAGRWGGRAPLGASAKAVCYLVPLVISGQESVQLRLSALCPTSLLGCSPVSITGMPPAPGGMLSPRSPKVGCLSISSHLLPCDGVGPRRTSNSASPAVRVAAERQPRAVLTQHSEPGWVRGFGAKGFACSPDSAAWCHRDVEGWVVGGC